MSRLLVVLAAAVLPSCAQATAMGALKLDNYTFDKIVNIPGHNILAKFDESYAYGDKENEFKELCKLSHGVKKFMIGEVPVSEYGDKDNSDLASRYGLKKEDFPAYFLFKGSGEAKTRFEGFPDPVAKRPESWNDEEDGAWEAPMRKEITADNLALWLRKQGIKMASVGTIAEMDEVAKNFLKNGLKNDDIEAAKKLRDGDHKDDKKAAIYVKIMEKIKEKGEGYIEKEVGRVEKIMAGKVTPEKKEELSTKLKILRVFTKDD